MASAAALVPDLAQATGRIGPNSVIQLALALEARSGNAMAIKVFASAGYLRFLSMPPREMVDECVPRALFDALWRTLPESTAYAIADDAGRRTARYIIENRIPRIAQLALRIVPKSIARRTLLSAIERNAWTFAGSGRCQTRPGDPALIEIISNPLSMPNGVWHQAVFFELFDRLIGDTVRMRYSTRTRESGPVCQFELRF